MQKQAAIGGGVGVALAETVCEDTDQVVTFSLISIRFLTEGAIGKWSLAIQVGDSEDSDQIRQLVRLI